MAKRFQNSIQLFQRIDQRLCTQIFNWGGKRVRDRFMFIVSHIGYGYLYPVILLLIFWQGHDHARVLLPAGLIAFTIAAAGQSLIKIKSHRARPFEALPGIAKRMNAPDKFSFPSGHAAGAFLMATLWLHAYPVLSLPFFLFAGTVGLSRIYMGMHYPSDVMVGSIMGILSARLGILLML